MNANKSSVVELHNFMSKLHDTPIYEFKNKFGKSHKPWFRYRCKAMGDEVIGTGRSKRDAKNVVARMMLEQLSLRGYLVPPEFANPNGINQIMEHAGIPTRSFVVLLNEFCASYHLDPVDYEVLAGGTPSQPNFTVRARLGHVQRIASAASKRMATQLAAEQIYKHLRTRLSGARSFDEDAAMVRAYQRAMTPTAEERAAEERRNEERRMAAARQQKNKQRKNNGAVQATVRLEQDESETPVYDSGPGPMSPGPHDDDENDRGAAGAAMSFIERTMERLGL